MVIYRLPMFVRKTCMVGQVKLVEGVWAASDVRRAGEATATTGTRQSATRRVAARTEGTCPRDAGGLVRGKAVGHGGIKVDGDERATFAEGTRSETSVQERQDPRLCGERVAGRSRIGPGPSA